MQQLELSNAEDLDLEYSNFRLFGIGKPSTNQIKRWENKGKVAKISRLVDKGKINPAQLQPSTRNIISYNGMPVMNQPHAPLFPESDTRPISIATETVETNTNGSISDDAQISSVLNNGNATKNDLIGAMKQAELLYKAGIGSEQELISLKENLISRYNSVQSSDSSLPTSPSDSPTNINQSGSEYSNDEEMIMGMTKKNFTNLAGVVAIGLIAVFLVRSVRNEPIRG